MADKLVSQDPAQPGVFKVNGPTLGAGGKIALSGLDTTGAAVDDVIKFDGANWIPGVAPTTGANVGVGTGTIFRNKTTNTLNLKTLLAGTGITIGNGANEITINSTAAISGVFTESFTSGDQAITSAGGLTIAHGMTGVPTLVVPYIRCTAAENGYSIGDINFVNIGADSGGYGLSVVPTATNLVIRYAVGNVFNHLNKGTGGQTTITPASWVAVFKAWR